jgi:hypothetical protein
MSKATAQSFLGMALAAISTFFGGMWRSFKTAVAFSVQPTVVLGSMLVGFGLSVVAGGTLAEIVIGGLAMSAVVQGAVVLASFAVVAVSKVVRTVAGFFMKKSVETVVVAETREETQAAEMHEDEPAPEAETYTEHGAIPHRKTLSKQQAEAAQQKLHEEKLRQQELQRENAEKYPASETIAEALAMGF